MPHPLDSCASKIHWAQQHAEKLAAEVAEFLNLSPYRVEIRVDSDARRKSGLISVDRIPPDAISLLVGDVVHNLRSALDHLAGRLVELGPDDPTVKPQAKPEFPIYWQRTEYSAYGARKMRGAPDAVLELVEQLQPFAPKNGNWDNPWAAAPRQHPLWVLNWLDIVDKHRRLNVVGCARPAPYINIGDGGMQWLGGSGGLTSIGITHNGEMFSPKLEMPSGSRWPLEDGTQLWAVTFPDHDAAMQVEDRSVFDLAVEHEEAPSEPQTLLETMTTLGNTVINVVNSFGKFFPDRVAADAGG